MDRSSGEDDKYGNNDDTDTDGDGADEDGDDAQERLVHVSVLGCSPSLSHSLYLLVNTWRHLSLFADTK